MKNSISLGFVLLVLSGSGCAKSMSASSAPSEGRNDVYSDGADAEMGSGYAEESMDAPVSAPAGASAQTASLSSVKRPGLFGRRANRNASKTTTAATDMAQPAPGAPPNVSPSTSDSDARPEPADERSPEVETARHIIYTAGMRVAVFNVSDAMETAEALPDRFGGYVQSMSDNSIVLRLPSKVLRDVMATLNGYGNVEQRWMRSQDVTAEFTDIESRIRALEETQTQLLRLLDKTRTVDEALRVRQALDRITSELEVLKGRMRQLGNMTMYSTLTLEFYERGPHNPTPSSNDPFPWVDSLGVEGTEWK